MGWAYFDRRLQAVTDQTCPRCRRPDARANGTFHAIDDRGWRIELTCDRCGDGLFAPPGDDPRIRQVLRAHTDGDPALFVTDVAEDSVPRDPPLAPPRDAVIHVHETVSELARSLRRPFILDLLADGAAIHEDAPTTGKFPTMQIRRQVVAPDVLAPLHDLLTHARLPPDVGRGDHHATFAWPGAEGPRTVRWNQHASARDVAGDPAIGRPILALIDGLRALLEWIDAGAPAPRWPDVDILAFPRVDDLLAGTAAARLTRTHDWDGARRCVHTDEIWLSAAGTLERRTLRTDDPLPVLEASRTRELAAGETRDLFARLRALDPAGFRRALGFVRGSCGLDTTYHEALDWFDGHRVHRTTLVHGSERGLGTSHGDTPPNEREAAAFRLLSGLRL